MSLLLFPIRKDLLSKPTLQPKALCSVLFPLFPFPVLESYDTPIETDWKISSRLERLR
jgi:hypothetical protein